jgi:dTDP-4-amino-4,6-dideoxygalactose transaminase
MSELHAAMALASFDTLDERLGWRRVLAERFRSALEHLPGLSFPRAAAGDRSTYREFVVLIEPRFGRPAAQVVTALRMRDIDAHLTCPVPLHRAETGLSHASARRFQGADVAASRAVSLPIWDRMRIDELDAAVRALRACRGGNVRT